MKSLAPYSEDEIIDRPVKLEPRVRDVKSKQSKQQPVIVPVCINYDHKHCVQKHSRENTIYGCEWM